MKTKYLILILLLTCGCHSTNPVVAPKPTQFTASEPTIDSQYPDFIVTYTRQLTGARVLTIAAESRPWLGGDDYLSFSDGLQQANGNWVAFDCDHIADKIIDANLVKEITPYCVEGRSLGRTYWKQHNYTPNEFVDKQGNRWKRE